MAEIPGSGRRGALWLGAVATGGAIAVGVGFAVGALGGRHASRAPLPRAPIAPFGQLEIDRSELPRTGPVPIALALAEPSADANPLPASLLSMVDKRMMQTEARLDETRTVVTIEIDATW